MDNRLYNTEHKEFSKVAWISYAPDKIIAEMIQNKNFRSTYIVSYEAMIRNIANLF